MKSAPAALAATPAFSLRGEFFELPLPAGWRMHPRQQQMADFAAVNGRYELIIATDVVDLAKAQQARVSFEEVLRQLAETRRSVSVSFAADPKSVEVTQSQVLGDIPTFAFRARLSQAPLAGVTQLTVIIGVPGLRAGTSSKRPVLTLSLYDYNGGTPDELSAFAHHVLADLRLPRLVDDN